MTWERMGVRKYEGFDSIEVHREPLEVPSLDGMYRNFVAGPYMDFDAVRNGIHITIKDWPATKGQLLVIGLRDLIDAAEGKPTNVEASLKARAAFYTASK
jgi:hypothetical protein